MTNLEKLIETLQNAPIERTSSFICNYMDRCIFCSFQKDKECTVDFDTDEFTDTFYHFCEQGVKQWFESEVIE